MVPPPCFRNPESSRESSSPSRLTAVLAACLVTVAVHPVSAQDAPPSYEGYREGRFLRYLNAHEAPIAAVPRIGLSFGDRTLNAVIDSGSTGIVVAARYIPGFESLPSIGEGRLTYSSSGRVMIGRWVVTPLALVGRDGARVETEPMPVLGGHPRRMLGATRATARRMTIRPASPWSASVSHARAITRAKARRTRIRCSGSRAPARSAGAAISCHRKACISG